MKPFFYSCASTAAFAATFVFAAPAMAQSNSSEVTQTGEFNEATVTQTGSDNTSTVTQDGTIRPPASGDGVSNRATLNQRGTGGTSEIDQTGDNGAFVGQTATSADVVSIVVQENAGGGPINVAVVRQEGTGGGAGSLTGRSSTNPASLAARGCASWSIRSMQTVSSANRATLKTPKSIKSMARPCQASTSQAIH